MRFRSILTANSHEDYFRCSNRPYNFQNLFYSARSSTSYYVSFRSYSRHKIGKNITGFESHMNELNTLLIGISKHVLSSFHRLSSTLSDYFLFFLIIAIKLNDTKTNKLALIKTLSNCYLQEQNDYSIDESVLSKELRSIIINIE